MRFGSVCSGIEAATVASAHLGWDAAWFSEIEKFPSAVLAHHYPNTPNHGDMMLLPLAIRDGKVEAPDMLVGGTPCQAFSVAGRREGLEDARGNLTLTFCEIADAIDEVRHEQGKQPAIIFWENVPGVLSDKTNAFGCFLAELAGEEEPFVPPTKWTKSGIVVGPKRTIAWRTLDAQYFGLAQRRQRVFVIASSRTDIHPAKILLEFGGVRRDSAPCRGTGKETATDAGTGVAGATTYGIPGNWIGRKPENGGNAVEPMVDISPCLPSTDRHGAATSFGQYAEGVGTIRASGGDLGGGSETLAIYENHPSDSRVTGPYDFSHTLTSKMGTGGGNVPLVGPAYVKGGEVCDTGCSKWQKGYGGPAGSETGNMVMQPIAVATKQFSQNIGENIANPLCVCDYKETQAVAHQMQVRRLTPVECERLQGFPDDYTNIPWRGKAESPDGPRYKALGNSWAVNCVRWIFDRIDDSLK